ncbi:MAG: DUF2325 domain-containing protein [Desulfobacteraceae bacterium]|nr:DUF2325 domain-containing protein [Desulfobacteraceae bacterium]
MASKQKEQNLINIWETHSCFICPVAGFCFSDFEIKKILKTPGNPKLATTDSYELHQAIMAKLGERNRTSEKADRFLRQKYAKALDRFGAMDEAAFQKAWVKGLLTDAMPAMFFVAAIRRDLSADFLSKVYGDVHMTGYGAMAAMSAGFQERDAAVEKTEALKALLSEEKHRNADLVDENIRLKASGARKPVPLAPETVDTPGQISAGERILALEEQLACKDREIRRLERERRKAEIRMFESMANNEQLERELNQLIAGFAQVQASPKCTKEACPNFDACSKRILIVGGLTKLKEMYRKIVESKGGIFDYHSGRIRNGKNNLEARVKRSDLVICPVNHNSHNACLKVKHFCNKHNKDIHMIPGSSLTAISTVFEASGLEEAHEPCPLN